MTDISGMDIDHLATLARLNLSSEEKERFSKELPKILVFVDELQKVEIDDAVTPREAVALDSLREDEPRSDHLSLEQIAKIAPKFENNQLVVPAVFGEQVDA